MTMDKLHKSLFQNLYGPETENPTNESEIKREEIIDLIKESLSLLNKARTMARINDDVQIQDDITKALNIFFQRKGFQQTNHPGRNLFEDYSDMELFEFYYFEEKNDPYDVCNELDDIYYKYGSFRRCYEDLRLEIAKRWHQQKIKTYRNKRNPNKYLEVHNDGHYHNSLKQYMFWSKNPDGAVLSDPIKNVTGDRKLHRWRKENLNVLLEDYELVEG